MRATMRSRLGNGLGSLTHHLIGVLGGGGGGALDDPILTRTSAAGTNPLAWRGTYNNSLIYDGAGNGDKVRMRFRLNGGAWTTEVDQPLDAATVLAGTYAWPLYNATSYPVGGTVDVQEQKARFVGGVEVLTSNWAQLTDTIGALPFAPSQLFGAGDVGYAWDTTDGAHVWQTNAGATAGAFASVVGRVDDISGKGNNLSAEGNDATRPIWTNSNNGVLAFLNANSTHLKSAGGFYAKGAMTWIGFISGAATQGNFVWAEDNTSSSGPVYAPGLRGSSATQMTNYQRNDASAALAVNMNAAILDGNPHIYMIEDTGTQLTLWVDGVQTAQAAYARNGPLGLTSNAASYLGAANAAGSVFSKFTGNVGSGIAIGRTLTGALGTAGTEKTKAYNWIATKHGLATL